MANYDWLKVPGDTLFTSLPDGEALKNRVSTLEQGSSGPAMTTEQIQAYVQGIVDSSSPAALVPGGVWDATISYTKPTVVVGSDGNTYMCKAIDSVTGVDPVVDTSAWVIFGERGLQGPTGADGEAGATGQTGPAGEKGDTGEQGIQGIQGIQGPAGQNAVSGITGKGFYNVTTTYAKDNSVIGSDNNAYLCLIDGTVGKDPTTDTSGAWCPFVMQGPQGKQGVQGPQGVQGLRGETGPMGPQGLSGPPGKDAPAASIGLSALTPTLQNDITAAAKLAAGSSEGSWGEIDTGKLFRGKKVYRQDFTLYVNAGAGSVDMTLIATPNYVDTIISQGGMWAIGFQTEKHGIPGTIDGTNASQVLIWGSDNILIWRSKANNARSAAMALIIVEYTKK